MTSMSRDAVALFAGNGGWHERVLKSAFEARGARCRSTPLDRCRLDRQAPTAGIVIPGFPESLPRAAFVRGISAGSFEQVTFRLTVLHALAAAGVVVYNDARAIERTVDKGMTSWRLAAAGVPSPPAWTCESRDEALSIASTELAAGARLVLKPLFGSRGKGLVLVDRAHALPVAQAVSGVYYLQRFVERPASGSTHEDWRVMVVSGRALAAMRRTSNGWITNRAQGGECAAAALEPALCAPAVAAAEAAGAAYAGVDLVRDRDGAMVVLEVNGIPAFQGLQSATGVDIAGALADDLLRRSATAQPVRA